MLDSQNFREVGKALAERYDGYFHNFIKSCPPQLYDNGKGLVDRLVTEFPRFNDVSEYDSHEIKFYKLAQLGFWGIYSGLHSTNSLPLADIGKMTAFAEQKSFGVADAHTFSISFLPSKPDGLTSKIKIKTANAMASR